MTGFYALATDEQAQRLEVAARDALKHWDRADGSLSLIKHRENAVFEVAHNGERTALRLHRYGYHSDAALRSELLWMEALREAGIAVPRVIPTANGHPFVSYPIEGLPGPIQIDLFEWIEGEQLGSVEEGIGDQASAEATYRAIGALAGRLHNQSSSWSLPSGFERHAWDADGLAGEQPFWGRFWEVEAADSEQRALLARGRDAVFADLSALAKSPDSYSMIHADFVQENVLVHNGEPRLIDFDDAGFGWHLFELATSLYFIQSEPFYEAAKAALLAGYRSERELTNEQLSKLPLFMLARGFTYIGWVHTRSETETARELTPMLLDAACALAEEYLNI